MTLVANGSLASQPYSFCAPRPNLHFFIYLIGAGGDFISLGISLALIAAAASRVNTDLLDESLCEMLPLTLWD